MCDMTQKEAFARLRYDSETGQLIWVSAAKNKQHIIGEEAGRVEANGYRYIKLNGKMYAAHRLIWLMQTGRWPTQMIDHIDGTRTNNKWKNLRDVDATTNGRNRHAVRKDCASGTPGVYEQNGRWYAYSYQNGVKHSLGGHGSIDLAIAARAAFKNQNAGEAYV